MLCPYCVSDIATDAAKCSHCSKEIPPLYRMHYPRGLGSRGPIIMSAVGFGGHGKTIYFAALLHAIDMELPKIWPGFYRQAIDDEAVKTVSENLQLLEQGSVPLSTRQNFPQPNVHCLVKIPGKKEKMLAIYDASGESFVEGLRVERFAGYLKRARAVMFLVSLDDLEPPIHEDIHRLLNIYVQGMARLKAKPKDQHLLVVFTKADALRDRFRDYPDVVAHLSNPSYTELGDLKRYTRKLESISRALRDYTNNTLSARLFVNMADESFKSVNYCAVSSLGAAPEDGHLKEKMTPIRVVDPLLWLLERG
jgi:hypothetical protein